MITNLPPPGQVSPESAGSTHAGHEAGPTDSFSAYETDEFQHPGAPHLGAGGHPGYPPGAAPHHQQYGQYPGGGVQQQYQQYQNQYSGSWHQHQQPQGGYYAQSPHQQQHPYQHPGGVAPQHYQYVDGGHGGAGYPPMAGGYPHVNGYYDQTGHHHPPGSMQGGGGQPNNCSPSPLANSDDSGGDCVNESKRALTTSNILELIPRPKGPRPTTSVMSAKRGGKRARSRDPNEPQKPVSAYALFFRDVQAGIKAR